MRQARLFLILIGLVGPQQAWSETAKSVVPADANQSGSRWIAPEPEQAKQINEKLGQPAKVRLGLRLTPFRRVVTKTATGATEERYVPGEPLRHTLRARLNQTNHFFVGEWHVETVPVKWILKTRNYTLKINLYRRYGAFGQLEENVGSVNLAGVLDEQQPGNVHVLLGVARQRLRDKAGHPVVDVVAGFTPGAKPDPALSLGGAEKSSPPATPPADYTGELVRGRF